jgi:hypothetical protein
MTDHQIVICQNDFPIGVLPAGATHQQAIAHCAKLDAQYAEMREREGKHSSNHFRYFHWHQVPVESVE